MSHSGPVPDPAPIAALYLGRIQGAVQRASQESLRILAARMIRESLIAALRQEGHAFTEQRFYEWFAGLKTLSDVAVHSLRPPKAICQAIFTELLHSSWPQMAVAAENLLRAFLAPADFLRDDAHEDTHTVIAQARALIESIEPSREDLPFQAVAALFSAVHDSPLFGAQERAYEILRGGTRSIALETGTPPSARWALDLLAGTRLSMDWCSPLGRMPLPTPLPGLVDLSHGTHETDDDLLDRDGTCLSESAFALRSALWKFEQWLSQAQRQADTISLRSPGQRSTGRTGPVLEALAGFGPLRGAQIERLVGASRLGVRSILAAIGDAGLLASVTAHNRTMIYRYAELTREVTASAAEAETFAFSQDSLDEFEASMKALDDLLERSSRSSEE